MTREFRIPNDEFKRPNGAPGVDSRVPATDRNATLVVVIYSKT